MLLINPEKIKDYEVQANALGFSFDEMMRVAGNGLAHEVNRRFNNLSSKKITGLIGGGKNGADTLIALTSLSSLGWEICAIKVASAGVPEWVSEEYKKSGCPIIDFQEAIVVTECLKNAGIILDGILGTGFVPPMRRELAEKMEMLKNLCNGKLIVAVDCPSGIDCKTGAVEKSTLFATLTVCMEAVKTGLLKFPALNFIGEICTVDVGILKKLKHGYQSDDVVIDPELVASKLPVRKNEDHKGSYGSVLVCGGSVNYPGAPVFSARAAYQAGTGLVKTAVPERIYDLCASQCLESTWLILDDERGVISESAIRVMLKEMTKVKCLVIGPGLGTEDTTFRFFKGILLPAQGTKKTPGVGFIPNNRDDKTTLESYPPMVVDADGLRLLARIPEWEKKVKYKLVLTPHPGEMSALTDLPIADLQEDRFELCRRFAAEWQQVVVLKGALTVIANPEGRLAVCPVASSALAKAGSGDVLTGLIAGLIAQGMSLFDAALVGVWVHANAGLLAAAEIKNERSVGINQIINHIPDVIARMKKK